VVIDVLRFTTAVEAAVSLGVEVYPYRWMDDSAAAFARQVGAELEPPDQRGIHLSPTAILSRGDRGPLLIPSPNGATCSLEAADRGATVVAGCLRNAAVVAEALRSAGGSVGVVAAGERWPDGSLRPCWEDLLGAGAVLAHLGTHLSVEASAAAAAFLDARSTLPARFPTCTSARELVAKGLSQDVVYATQVDASRVVPRLVDGRFTTE
jgi:2-phosphosulfolactate phosphatase